MVEEGRVEKEKGSVERIPKRRGRPPAGRREAILASALELIRERGIGRLTTRELAASAGVSEASIFYHYNDRAGLLKAVFEEGLRPVRRMGEEGIDGPNPRETLMRFGHLLERFFDQVLPIQAAAQSDTALRDTLASYMIEQDIGPHRGVQALGKYLAREQAAGRVRRDVDPQAVAATFIGACYLRASRRQMALHDIWMPPLEDVTATLDAMLAPV